MTAATLPAMSAFHPTTITLHPPPPDDPQAVALITALNRDLSFRRTMNLPTVLLLGLISAGLAPLVILLLRFRSFAAAEKFQLEHVAEWMQRDGASLKLDWEARLLGSRWRGYLWLGLGCALGALLLAVWTVAIARRAALHLWTWYPLDRDLYDLGHGYIGVMVIAYICLILAIEAHHSNVNRFVRAAGFAPARLPVPSWIWLVTAAALGAAGSFWGLAMMLAAGAHRRYTKEVSLDLRARIAQRIEQMRGPDAHGTKG